MLESRSLALGARLRWGLAWKRHKGTPWGVGVMAVFYVLIVVVVTQVHPFIKTLHLKWEHFINKLCLSRFEFYKYRLLSSTCYLSGQAT